MNLWQKLQSLSPSYRRAQEQEMRDELDALSALAGPRELGNLTRAAEDARAVWQWTLVEQFFQDLQYALRAMRHTPAFTAAAVLSLALGIGANTAIFSLIDAIMLRWLPVRDPQQLVLLQMRAPGAERAVDTFSGSTFSYAITQGLAGRTDLFAGVGGFSAATFRVGPPGSIVRVPGTWATGDYFRMLGLNPAMGRLLTPADDVPGSPPVAVISYGYWERQMAADPAVIGRSILINGVPVQIAGVSPRGFEGATVGALAEITLTAAALPRIDPESAGLLGPGNFWLRILARPRSEISPEELRTRLAALWPGMSEQVLSPGWSTARRQEMARNILEAVPGGTGHTFLREMLRRPLMILMGVVTLVLLIACANVANLLLARATARQREISVRLAIGAGRGRVIRQLLTESVLLAAFGAALGVGLAWLATRLLVNSFSIGGPFSASFDVTPNGHILAFTSAVAIGTALLFGLAPALQTTAGGASAAASGDARVTRSRSRLVSAQAAAQLALSLILLMGAGLFVRTLQNLLAVDPGFRREGILLVNVDGRKEGHRNERLPVFYKELLDRLRPLPGVVAATISSHTPLSGSTWSEAAVPLGQPLPQRDNAIFIAAGPEYFQILGTPVITGRAFNRHDEGPPTVAIVNQSYAARHFAGKNPVGQLISATVTRPPATLEIVGVVKDTRNAGLRAAPGPLVYVPYFQRKAGEASLVIRAAGSISQTAAAIRTELQPSFPSVPIEVAAFSEQVEQTIVQERLLATFATAFGILGLALACVGVYGLMAYGVARRTREIGVRMALGAGQANVQWMVVKNALRLVAFGLALGLPAAWAASRWVKAILFGLTPTDPAAIATASFLLTAAALLAAWFPARRAAKVDPMTALRHD